MYISCNNSSLNTSSRFFYGFYKTERIAYKIELSWGMGHDCFITYYITLLAAGWWLRWYLIFKIYNLLMTLPTTTYHTMIILRTCQEKKNSLYWKVRVYAQSSPFCYCPAPCHARRVNNCQRLKSTIYTG